MKTDMLQKIFLILMALHSTLLAAAEIAVVAKTGGEVLHHSKNETSWTPLNSGVLLENRTSIKTGVESFSVVIYLDDKSTIKIRPRTEVIIQGKKENNQILKTIKMFVGETLYDFSKNGQKFKVETPTSIASVKGTTFFVAVSPVDNSTTLYGIEGVLSVKGKNRTQVELTKGYKAISSEKGIKLYKMSKKEWNFLLGILNQEDGKEHITHISHKVTMNTTNGGRVINDESLFIPDNIPHTISAKADPGYYFYKWRIVNGFGTLFNQYSRETELMLNGSNITLKPIFNKEDKRGEEEEDKRGEEKEDKRDEEEEEDEKTYSKLAVLTDDHSVYYGLQKYTADPTVYIE